MFQFFKFFGIVFPIIILGSNAQIPILSQLALKNALRSLQTSPQSLASLATTLPICAPYLPLNTNILINTIGSVVGNIDENAPFSTGKVPLARFNIAPEITVSGLSGGAAFSTMISFIHSSFVKGAGIFSGAPFPVVLVATSQPNDIYTSSAYYPIVDGLASQGLIDPTANLQTNFGEYIYRGTNDYVPAEFSQTIIDEFVHYGVPTSKVQYVSNIQSGHCIPVSNNNQNQLQTCQVGDEQAICNCGYDSINKMFTQLYPTTFSNPFQNFYNGELTKFDQNEFFPNNNAFEYGWWDFGYLYVPRYCLDGNIQCKLHIVFHGCGENELAIYGQRNPKIITDTGYLQAADKNNYIIIFPQARITLVNGSIGCFDFYGFTSTGNNTFATRNGVQPAAVKKIYERILNGV